MPRTFRLRLTSDCELAIGWGKCLLSVINAVYSQLDPPRQTLSSLSDLWPSYTRGETFYTRPLNARSTLDCWYCLHTFQHYESRFQQQPGYFSNWYVSVKQT